MKATITSEMLAGCCNYAHPEESLLLTLFKKGQLANSYSCHICIDGGSQGGTMSWSGYVRHMREVGRPLAEQGAYSRATAEKRHALHRAAWESGLLSFGSEPASDSFEAREGPSFAQVLLSVKDIKYSITPPFDKPITNCLPDQLRSLGFTESNLNFVLNFIRTNHNEDIKLVTSSKLKKIHEKMIGISFAARLLRFEAACEYLRSYDDQGLGLQNAKLPSGLLLAFGLHLKPRSGIYQATPGRKDPKIFHYDPERYVLVFT